jgi:hypothetical protein
MEAHACCATYSAGSRRGNAGGRTAVSGPPPPRLRRRFAGSFKYVIPAAVLAVLPKCPLCLAAYLAVGTGLGVSLSTATYFRGSLVTLCVTSLSYFAIAGVVSAFRGSNRDEHSGKALTPKL